MAEEKTNWNRISFGKCKHAYLVEAFKALIDKNALVDGEIDDIELKAEEWALRSMRILGDFGEEPKKPNLTKDLIQGRMLAKEMANGMISDTKPNLDQDIPF